MLRRFFAPELFNCCATNDLDPFAMTFMQDGARAHIRRDVRDFITQLFDTSTLGERLAVHWPARSPDLTPCDFFLWGWLKSEVYMSCPFPDLPTLERKIQDVISSMDTVMCVKACRSVLRRLQLVGSRGGRHIEHVL